MTGQHPSPAELAAAEAQAKVNACLDAGKSFRLEAGAGAGKTYSLVQALKRLIAQQGTQLLQAGQRVACITYTEVARDEIAREVGEHPSILVETIHAFSWRFMAQFQKPLRELVAALEDRQEKITEGGGVVGKRVEYNLGFFGVDADKVTLGHDDVPLFMARLIGMAKFRKLLSQAFPVLFIDEYQDTDKNFMAALCQHFFAAGEGPLIGLFGDHWQTIYRGEYSLAEFPGVEGIDKGSNFRSAPAVVKVLNMLRPELPQQVSDPEAQGEARFFHANSYTGPRTNTPHSKFDVPDDVGRGLVAKLRARLEADGWDFDPTKTKILMLTHSALAAEQGYPTIADIFDRKEAFAKKEDPTIAFLGDVVEPMFRAYGQSKYGEMFRILGGPPPIKSHGEKVSWRASMQKLGQLRQEGTIGAVLDHLKDARRPRVADTVARREEELSAFDADPAEEEPKTVSRQRNLRAVPYKEVVELVRFLEGHTPFATQHSVKGAEFENVLVILGGGWNHYNWPQLLELLETNAITDKNRKGYYRTRNLFYVAVSRPKKRLAVLATQTMSVNALATAARLFGADGVHELVL